MADALTVSLSCSLDWLFNEALDLSTVSDSHRFKWAKDWTDGTGTGNANLIWHYQGSIAAGSHAHDLIALPQTFYGTGATFNFDRIKALIIVNTSTTAGDDIYLDQTNTGDDWDTNAPWSSGTQLDIPADSFVFFADQYGSGWNPSSANSVINIDYDGAGTIIYKLIVIGLTA